jgi:tetratricopeptide (TPR) repeat protein
MESMGQHTGLGLALAIAVFASNSISSQTQAQSNESLLIHKYSELIDKNPRDINSLLTRGLLYRKLYFYDEAIADFKAVLRINPKNIEAKRELDITYKAKRG